MKYIRYTHVYKQNDLYNLKLDAYLPENSVKSLPVVIYIHGGALIFGSRKDVNENEIQAILNEGIAYISVDYRLPPETKLMDIIVDV